MSGSSGTNRPRTPAIPTLLALLVIWPGGHIAAQVAQQDSTQLPEGVTKEKIELGNTLFSGEAGCHVCHGRLALGLPNWTSDLTDSVWLKVRIGTYEEIMAQIRSGVTPGDKGGITMPPLGRKDLTDEQVQALAAYLWSINQRKN